MKKESRDSDFFLSMLALATPIALQNLIASGLNTLDTFMISSLKEAAVSGVGFANKIFFFFALITFGINTGSATFVSQYIGKGDIRRARMAIGLSLTLSLIASSVFVITGLLAPEFVIGLFTKDQEALVLGSKYLRTVVPSYILTAINFSLAVGFRATGKPRIPLYSSIAAFFTNAIGNYILIFGHFGFPAMGVTGAALATLLARVVEFFILIYASRKNEGPMHFKLAELFHFEKAFVIKYLKVTSPVIIEEAFWALGQVFYIKSYALLGIDSVASIQITTSILDLFFVFSRGMSNAATIMIGKQIGAGKSENAYSYAVRFIKIAVLLGAVMGISLYLTSDFMIHVFSSLKPEVRQVSVEILKFSSFMFIIRNINNTIVVGILRGGGDTTFSMFYELGTMWIFGVPLAFFGAIFLNVSVYQLYQLISLEEVLKFMVGIPRVFSKKWIKDLTLHKEFE